MRVELIKNTLHVYTDHADPVEVAALKALPLRRFQHVHGRWLVPYIAPTYEAWVKLMPWPAEIPPPTSMGADVKWDGKRLVFSTPYSPKNVKLCQEFPGRRKWSAAMTAWLVWPSPDNVQHILEHWPYAEWKPTAMKQRDRVLAKLNEFAQRAEEKRLVIEGRHNIKWEFGTTPYDHQLSAFAMSRDREVFALFMEQGTGKTKVIVDNACFLYEEGRLDAVVVVSPNSVKSTWEEEIEVHAPERIPIEVAIYSSAMTGAEARQFDHVAYGEGKVLRFLILNVEAFSSGMVKQSYKIGKKRVASNVTTGEGKIANFMTRHRSMLVVDESTTIKTPGARRTKSITRVAQLAPYRRILSGTPITQGALDLWSQFRLLDVDILGAHSFYAFRNRMANVDQWGRIEGYKPGALESLKELIEPHSYRVTRDECLDLPPKVFEKRWVEMTKTQAKMYKQMRSKMTAELNELEHVTATIVLTQMLRLQQIVGGFAPVEDPFTLETINKKIAGGNPKVEEVMRLVEEAQGKVIIWARFVAEIDAIATALADKYGEATVGKFYGPTPNDERTAIRRRFQDADDPLRFFVGNQATGRYGLTLTQGTTVIYYSNSFSLDDRLQSEDRAMRIGQDSRVVYVDLLAKGTIDQKVVASLRGKKKIAGLVIGDEWKEWI